MLERYRHVIEIGQKLNSTYDLTTLLMQISKAAEEILQVEGASIILLDESSKQLRFAAASNKRPNEIENIIIPIDTSIAGWVVRSGEPRIIQDVTQEPRHFQGVDNAFNFDSRSLLCVPMRYQEKTIGVLQTVNKLGDGKFQDDDIETLMILAGQAAVAIQNARLFQQSDFISEMVHELRTPLAALRASTSILLNDPELPDNFDETLGLMQSETNRLIQLTSEFLDVARWESGRYQLDRISFPIYDAISECFEIIRHQADEKNIHIHDLDYQNCSAQINADYTKMKQVFLNLLTNAIKYNQENGEIHISCEELENHLVVHVRDTGVGISDQDQRNMFQKFYRVPNSKTGESGTGLGLTISKHIVEAHGGNISVQSNQDSGTTFTVTLPYS